MSPLADGSSPESTPLIAPVEASSAPPAPVEERRYPSTIGGACYLGVLGVAVAAFVIVGLGHWRAGIHLFAAALLVAAVLRFLLPSRDAGMLAVRNRWLDGTLLVVFGGALWFLATTLPAAG